MTPEQRLTELGLSLPAPFPPAAAYVPARREGDLMFVSGHGPMRDGKVVYPGKLGRDLDVATGQRSAELTMLNILASLKAELGSLDRIRGFLKLLVFVHCVETFAEHHLVADGASQLVAALFPDQAPHARSAVGMMSLPFGISTEIEAIVAVTDD